MAPQIWIPHRRLHYQPVGGGLIPSDLSNLDAWYKGSDLGSVSSAISSWTDASGNSEHQENATGGEQPIVATFGTGKGADFDGSNDTLAIVDGPIPHNGVFTFATIFNIDDLSADDRTIMGNTGNNNRRIRVETNGSVGTRTSGSTVVLTATSAISAGNTYIVVMGRDSSDNYWIYIDGVDALSGTPSGGGTANSRELGSSNGSNLMDGIIGTTCLWGADHEASEQGIHDYLAAEH